MELLGYTMLVILVVAIVFFFIRSYRPVTEQRMHRRFIDLAVVFFCMYVLVTTTTYMSVTIKELVAGSLGVQIAMWSLAWLGVLMLILSVFYASWKRGLRTLRDRRQRRKDGTTVPMDELLGQHQPQ